MLTRKPWRLVPVLVAASTVTILTATTLPAAALDRSVSAAPAVAALQDDPLPEATPDEKYRAAVIVGAGDDLAMQEKADCDFVHDVSRRATGSVVTQEATTAVDSGSATACTLFIRQGIYDANARDREIQQRDRADRDARQAAAATISLEATPRLLGMTNYNFVVEVVLHAPGPLVKAAAEAALRLGTETALTEFITTGIVTNHTQDQLDKIAADAARTEAEKEAARQEVARRAALAAIGVVATPENLVLDDTNFIFFLMGRAVKGSEVAIAADAVLSTFDATKRQEFIHTGIHQAKDRDFLKNREKEAEEKRAEVRQIQAKAESSLVHPALVAAAKAALAGGNEAVTRFLADGKDAAIVQSFQASTPARKGWYLRASRAGTTIAPSGTGAGRALTDAAYRVLPGLGDTTCHSMESVASPGYYLRETGNRVLLAAFDGSDAFRTSATWCAGAGKAGVGVSLQSKSKPGRFLRHFGTAIYAAEPGAFNDYDRICSFNSNSSWTIGGAATPALANPGTAEFCGTLDNYHYRRLEPVGNGNPHENPGQLPDVQWKGYSGLVQADEAGAIRTIKVDGAKRTLTAGDPLFATPWVNMGEFTTSTFFSTPTLGSSGIVAVDRSTNKLWYYPQDGDDPATRIQVGTGWNAMRELTAGEFSDNNASGGQQYFGGRELLAVERLTGILWAYPGSLTSTTFGGRLQIGTGWNGYDKLTVGSFNGDDYNDLIAVERATGKLWLYPGRAGDGLGARTLLGASGWNAYTQLVARKVTDDARTDLIAVDELGRKWLFPQTGPNVLGARIALTQK